VNDATSTEEQVGRQLALIGDEVNERYALEFANMLRLLKIHPETAYEGFASIARE